MIGATVLGGIEITLEDVLILNIASWIGDDYFKVKRTSRDPSYSDPEASQWEYGPAAVHSGMLPRSEVGVVMVDAIPMFPFVLAHITKGKDMMPQGLVHTKIIVGMWDNNANFQGYRDAVALLRKIVRQIWYWNTLNETYQMEMSEGTDWRVYDTNEVTWPYFMTEATVAWRLRTPIMKAESEDLDYTPPPLIVPGNREADLPIWQPPTPGTP